MKIKNLAALIAAATVAVSLTGCAVDKENQTGDGDVEITERLPETLPPVGITPEDPPDGRTSDRNTAAGRGGASCRGAARG